MIHKDRNIQQRLFEINAKKIVLKEERFTKGEQVLQLREHLEKNLPILRGVNKVSVRARFIFNQFNML